MKIGAVFSVIFVFLIFNLTICIQIRNHQPQQHGWQLTTVSSQCCTQKSGILCGTVVKDCCKKGCQSGYFMSQWCLDSQIFNPTDCTTCTNVCESKGGVVCSTNVLIGTSIQCCKSDDCIGTITKSCNCTKNSIIQLAQYKIL